MAYTSLPAVTLPLVWLFPLDGNRSLRAGVDVMHEVDERCVVECPRRDAGEDSRPTPAWC